MITKYIKGDLLKTELDIIAQGVNCQNAMGSGVAKVIYEQYPLVKERYHNFCEGMKYQRGSYPEDLLGEIQSVITGGKTFVNCFTQLNYGYDGKRYLNYAALAECFRRLTLNYEGSIIAIPKIGCGLAGGDWNIIEQIINDVTSDKLEVWVYEL